MDLDSMKARQERQDLVWLAKPQGGVAAMSFPDVLPLTRTEIDVAREA